MTVFTILTILTSCIYDQTMQNEPRFSWGHPARYTIIYHLKSKFAVSRTLLVGSQNIDISTTRGKTQVIDWTAQNRGREVA